MKTKEPCKTPECDSPNWHLCPLDKSKPDRFPELLGQINKVGPNQTITKSRVDRDEAIVKLYSEGQKSMKQIAADLHVAYDTVRAVLHDAQDAGLVQIRKRGSVINHGAAS